MFDFEDALGVLGTLTEDGLSGMFEPQNIAGGRQLFEAGRVEDREVISEAGLGVGLEAIVDDGEWYLPNVFAEGPDTISFMCDCPEDGSCRHVAALLFAWLEAPDSFIPPTGGGFLDMAMNLESVRDTLSANVPDFDRLMNMLESDEMDLPVDVADMSVDELQAVASITPAPEGLAGMAEEVDEGVRQLLQGLTVSRLREIARRRDFELHGTRKDDIIDQLTSSLRETTGQPNFLADLTRDAYELFRMLNTVFGVRQFLVWDSVQWAWDQHDALEGDVGAVQNAFDSLQEYGLLCPCNQPAHSSGEHYHWLPYLAEVRLPVVKLSVKVYPEGKVRGLSKREATTSLPAAVATLVAFGEHRKLHLRELRPRHRQAGYYPWLGEWDHDPEEIEQLMQGAQGLYPAPAGIVLSVPLFQSLLTDEDLGDLAQWLDSQRDFASWLTLMAVAAGVLTSPTADRTPLAVQHDQWSEWYSLSPEAQLRLLLSIWRRHAGSMAELALAHQRKPNLRVQRTASYLQQFSPEDLALELTTARGFVTRLLQELPADVWYDWFSFAEAVRRMDPHFLHNYFGVDVWGFTVKEGKRLDPSRRADWDRGYRPVLAAFLEGPLRWLGVVDVGYKGPNLVAFRLTSTGAWLLRGEGRPTALMPDAERAPVVWLDDGRFHARPGPASAAILALAGGALATPTREAFVYELSNQGVQEVFSQGIEPTVIFDRFRQAGAPAPDATRERIDDLWSRFGHVHLYAKLTILELADDTALRELLANTKLRRHVVHRFSPRLVVVEDSAVDELVEELVKKGYTPKVGEQ
ncbi:MAG: hypothetical protein MAG451_02287 [Anaerolineales bacterium]|nr:hypothetical protein [Anaerolineales bacterium]